MADSKKIAVFFPGIGYNCSRPLLYYTAKLAEAEGYEILRLEYHDMPEKIRGNRSKMEESFRIGLTQTREQLKDVAWNTYREILFVSKSVGTIISGAYAKERSLNTRSILFTPLTDTFLYTTGREIIFHGTNDPWAQTSAIKELAQQGRIPLYITARANHSLESGDVLYDIEVMKNVMEKCSAYISTPLQKAQSEMVIRKCVSSDQMDVTNLYNDVVWYLQKHHNYPKWTYNEYPGYETVRLAIGKGEQYACWIGRRCVGAFILNTDPQGKYSRGEWSRPLTEYDYMVLHTLATAPDCMHRGFASEMIRYCIEAAQNLGKEALRADIVPDNQPCRNLLEKLGFTSAGTCDLGRGIDSIPAFTLYEKNWEKRF